MKPNTAALNISEANSVINTTSEKDGVIKAATNQAVARFMKRSD